MNSLFLNISTVNYIFEPCTKYHFIGLTKYLPDLILSRHQITLINDKMTMFQDYKLLYDGIYNNLVSKEGYYTPDFHKYDSRYFFDLTDIWRELYDLINLLVTKFIKKSKQYEFINEIINSPAQSIWFGCLFNELENVFFENGLLGENNTVSKKSLANNGIKSINNRLNKILDGIEPEFLTGTIPNNAKSKTCNKNYILAIAAKIATSDDSMYEKLKKYYQLEKRFFKKCRDDKKFQIGYINNCGTYTRGKIGRITHNL